MEVIQLAEFMTSFTETNAFDEVLNGVIFVVATVDFLGIGQKHFASRKIGQAKKAIKRGRGQKQKSRVKEYPVMSGGATRTKSRRQDIKGAPQNKLGMGPQVKSTRAYISRKSDIYDQIHHSSITLLPRRPAFELRRQERNGFWQSQNTSSHCCHLGHKMHHSKTNAELDKVSIIFSMIVDRNNAVEERRRG